MPSAELFILPIPGADPRKYSHREIQLLATEDRRVLNLLDTSDLRQACQIAKRHFPDLDVVVFTTDQLDASGCRTTHELPVWARRWRLKFAIEEGNSDALKALPMGLGRDLLFQGAGAFVKWQQDIIALHSDFRISIHGTMRSQSLDGEVTVSVRASDPPQLEMQVTYADSGGRRRFSLTVGREPEYLIPLFEQAFDLPGVPRLELIRDVGDPSVEITEQDLAALGMALGATALMPRDPQGGHMRLESALYDLEAQVRRAQSAH